MLAKLYKYRPFSVNSLRMITEAEVFYARPSSFNDPMDCDPTIEVDIGRASLEKLLFKLFLQTRDRDTASRDVGYLRYLSSEHGNYLTDPDVEDYLKRLLASDIKRELDSELGNAGVLSLSATWQSALMWSHYADEHRGICIEYDTTDQEHPHLGPVNYTAPRAIKTSDLWRWKMRDDAASADKVRQIYFYSKSSEWKYEREWRDVATTSRAVSVPFRMTAIHFGMRCDSAVVTSIVKLLADDRTTKLWHIRPKDDGFKLRRSLVDRDEIEAIGVREPSFLLFKDVVWPDLDEPAQPEPDSDDIPPVEIPGLPPAEA
jgi:hypothetical protein